MKPVRVVFATVAVIVLTFPVAATAQSPLDLSDFALNLSDVPAGMYVPDWASLWYSNEDLCTLPCVGKEGGCEPEEIEECLEAYEQAGRVDGYWISFYKNRDANLPDGAIYNDIDLYNTPENAHAGLLSSGTYVFTDSTLESIEMPDVLGDECS